MKVDLSEKTWKKVIKAIDQLDNINYMPLDTNEQSDWYEIMSVLEDFKLDIQEELDL